MPRFPANFHNPWKHAHTLQCALHNIRRSKLSQAIASVLYLPLVSDLFAGAGSYRSVECDFTRASIATVRDHEGKFHQCKVNEARFEGARRVHNLVTVGDIGGFGTAGNPVELSTDEYHISGLGLQYTESWFQRSLAGINLPLNNRYLGSIFVKAAVAEDVGKTVSLAHQRDTGGTFCGVTNKKITLTAEYTRYVTPSWVNIDGANIGIRTYVFAAADDTATQCVVKGVMTEDVTGRANTESPSEHVSVGVGTGPELVSNGGFSLDGTGWIEPAGSYTTTYPADTVVISRNSEAALLFLEQAVSPVAGKLYAVTVDVAAASGATWEVRLGGATSGYIPVAITGLNTFLIRAADTTNLKVGPTQNLNGTLTLNSVSVKEIDHGANVDGVKYFNTYPSAIVDSVDYMVSENGGIRLVVALGDSLTEGTWDEKLDVLTRANIVSKGVSGERLSKANAANAVEARWDADVRDIGVDGVIVFASINDLQTATVDPVPNMIATQKRLLRKAREAGIEYFPCDSTPFKGSVNWTAQRQAWQDEYRAWLIPWAAIEGLTLLPFRDAISDPADPETILAAYTSDFLHVNADGNQALADAAYTAIGARLDADRAVPTFVIGNDTVVNEMDFSNDLEESTLITSNGGAVIDDYQTFTSPSNGANIGPSGVVPNSNMAAFEVELKVPEGSPDIEGQLLIYDNTAATIRKNDGTFTITSTWTKHTIFADNLIPANLHRFYVYAGRASDTYPLQAQVRNMHLVYGTTTIPEFVSKGVLPYPYHGTGVDGAKPIGEAAKGYLSEPQSTNLLVDSWDYAAGWANGATLAYNASLDATYLNLPFTRVEGLGATGFHRLSDTSIASAADITYVWHGYVKAGEQTLIGLGIYSDAGAYIARTLFNLATGTISSTVEGTGSIELVDPVNSIYKITITGTTPALTTIINPYIFMQSLYSSASVPLGEGYWMGPSQLEVGGIPTSYIPTKAGAVTRTYDANTVDNSILPDNGSLSFDFRIHNIPNAVTLQLLNCGTYATGFYIHYQIGDRMRFFRKNGGPTNTNVQSLTPVVPSALHSIAVSWDESEIRICVDGETPVVIANDGTIDRTLPLDIGMANWAGGAARPVAEISDLKIYDEVFTGTNLQELTS